MNDIVHNSRAKMGSFDPAFKEFNPPLSKPIVEYSPQKRGDILVGPANSKGKSQWSKPIA